jgi:hypothetical protein
MGEFCRLFNRTLSIKIVHHNETIWRNHFDYEIKLTYFCLNCIFEKVNEEVYPKAEDDEAANTDCR